MRRNVQNIDYYNLVNASKSSVLSRIHKGCKNGSSDEDALMSCMFGFIRPRIADKSNCNSNYITYYTNASTGIAQGVSTWQGMCYYTDGQIVICGTTQPGPSIGSGLLYIGNISGNSPTQTYYTFLVPGSQYTSCYGPRYDFYTEEFTLVGSYNVPNNSSTYGFLFRGTLEDLQDPSKYVTEMQPVYDEYPVTFVYSTDGDFAVGASGSSSSQISQAWIYNITNQQYMPYSYGGSKYTTLYGIISNGNNTYTIIGGWTDGLVTLQSHAFIADMAYNTETGEIVISRETTFTFNNYIISHFEGISSTPNPNQYTLVGDGTGLNLKNVGFSCIVERTSNSFNMVKSIEVDCSCISGTSGATSCNSVLGNTVVAYMFNNNQSYQAVIDWNKVK